MKTRTKVLSLVSILIIGATLLGTFVIDSYAQIPIVFIDPSSQTVMDFDPSAPPTFTYNIMIADVVDLYAWGLRLTWDFDLLNLDITDVLEGGFLTGPLGTGFAKTISLADRLLDMGCTIVGDYPGVSGSGILATVTFTVRDAGETTLHLFDVELLDSNLNPIPYEVADGSFASLTSSPFEANLVMKRLDTHYFLYPSNGTSMWVYFKVKNTIGPYPLFVQVRFEMVREDGLVYRYCWLTAYVEPNKIVDLNCDLFLETKLAGKYNAVAAAYYSYAGYVWRPATKVKTFSFVIALG